MVTLLQRCESPGPARLRYRLLLLAEGRAGLLLFEQRLI